MVNGEGKWIGAGNWPMSSQLCLQTSHHLLILIGPIYFNQQERNLNDKFSSVGGSSFNELAKQGYVSTWRGI